jgi:hypothetical protein
MNLEGAWGEMVWRSLALQSEDITAMNEPFTGRALAQSDDINFSSNRAIKAY